jgi:undecaprenyl diphosphate synthase
MQAIRSLPKNAEINSELVKKLRDGHGEIPPADLIIRTSGENRTSDIGWLGTNSEFYSISKLLPDAGIKDFVKAILDYSGRERRFGARPK